MMRAACRSIRWNWVERTLRVMAVGALSSLGVLLVGLPGIAQEKDAKPSANSPTFSAEQIAFFEKQVQPILKSRCLKCHGGEEKIRGEFRVTSRAAILRGGESGPAAKPGDPMASSLIAAVEYRELEMPPSGKLPAGEIEILRRWVKDGLPWTLGSDVDEPEPHKPAARSGVVTEEARRYWAYQPLRRPSVPKPAGMTPDSNPIDAFLLERIQKAGLQPAGMADPVALARRVYYDLTGLPPTPAQIAEFSRDPSLAAYERLVDSLLQSPHYGEKWGRHWLDLVRYAESNGYERDNPKPQAWRYRDYVIQSLNADKPYDVFLREQLAGDELDEVTMETLTATGYYRLGIWDDEPADRPLARYDVLDGVVSTTAQVMLGMSLGCARCHEHKKDPIPHRDYYRFLAFFRDVTDMNGKNTRLVADEKQKAEHARLAALKTAQEAKWYGELYQLRQQFLAAWKKAGGRPEDGLAESDLTELKFRFYRDTWQSLPDFSSLKPETEGEVERQFVSLEPASRQESIGLVFEGRLKVPAAGVYTFDMDATEGVRLIVDGKPVINQPGSGRHEVRAEARLSAGLLPLRLEYFNGAAKPNLQLGWTGPDGERRSLSEDAAVPGSGRIFKADSRGKGQPWMYATDKPSDEWMSPEFDSSSWKRGPGGFGTRGTPGAIVRTEWNSRDIWLRSKFKVDKIPSRLALDVHHDEDVEVYLNGQRVFQATGYLREYQRVSLERAAVQALRQGENTLAVHCRQTGGGQYVDVGLVEGVGAEDFASLLREFGPRVWSKELVQRYEQLQGQLDESRKQKLPEPGAEVMCVSESGRAETTVLVRGNPGIPGEKVLPGVPAVLSADPNAAIPAVKLTGEAAAQSSGKRRALADWITSKENPLTARVMANRLWQFHFGRGIVPTPNDFGLLGELPTHPELLDWLASELMAGDWRLKRMHKLILMSTAYRRSSQGVETSLAKDPANHLWWRYPMRRLTAEEIRDSMLTASGQINLQLGGPSVYPPIPQEVLAGQSRPGAGWGKATPEEAARRSVYIHVKRSLIVPLLADNDAADTDSSCPVRYTTTVPTQSLGMLNGEFPNEQAVVFARRVMREKPGDLAGQVRTAVMLATARMPSDRELADDLKLIAELRQQHKLSEEAALTQFCLLLLNTNEFVYLD